MGHLPEMVRAQSRTLGSCIDYSKAQRYVPLSAQDLTDSCFVRVTVTHERKEVLFVTLVERVFVLVLNLLVVWHPWALPVQHLLLLFVSCPVPALRVQIKVVLDRRVLKLSEITAAHEV